MKAPMHGRPSPSRRAPKRAKIEKILVDRVLASGLGSAPPLDPSRVLFDVETGLCSDGVYHNSVLSLTLSLLRPRDPRPATLTSLLAHGATSTTTTSSSTRGFVLKDRRHSGRWAAPPGGSVWNVERETTGCDRASAVPNCMLLLAISAELAALGEGRGALEARAWGLVSGIVDLLWDDDRGMARRAVGEEPRRAVDQAMMALSLCAFLSATTRSSPAVDWAPPPRARLVDVARRSVASLVEVFGLKDGLRGYTDKATRLTWQEGWCLVALCKAPWVDDAVVQAAAEQLWSLLPERGGVFRSCADADGHSQAFANDNAVVLLALHCVGERLPGGPWAERSALLRERCARAFPADPVSGLLAVEETGAPFGGVVALWANTEWGLMEVVTGGSSASLWDDGRLFWGQVEPHFLPLYLDYNATTPLCGPAAEAVQRAIGCYGNPSSSHAQGRLGRKLVDTARAHVHRLAECGPEDEVVFTGCATEATSLAVRGAVEAAKPLGRDEVVTSNVEHPATSELLHFLSRTAGIKVITVPVLQGSGVLDLKALEAACGPRTALVTLIHVQNEIGVRLGDLQAIKAITQACGALLHSDASQAIGKLSRQDLALQAADLVTMAAHKWGGPKGVGALVIRASVKPSLLARVAPGAPHERGWRPGTENVLGIAGMGAAAHHLLTQQGWFFPDPEQTAARRDRLRDTIVAALGPEAVKVNGDAAPVKAINTLSLSFSHFGDWSGCLESLAVSAGSACHSGGSQRANPVLVAIGLQDCFSHTIRISIGPNISDTEIDFAAQTILRCQRKK
jgi:cysteine desulfurase